MTYSKERSSFKPTSWFRYFYIVGWGNTGPAHSFPLQNVGIFLFISRLLDYVILLLYRNSLDLNQAENQVFKPTSLFIIVGWGKTGPAHSFPLLNLSIFYWSFRLSVYVTLSLYFNIYERPIPKWESSFQSNKIIGTSTLLGGERLGRPILSPLQNLLIFLLIS